MIPVIAIVGRPNVGKSTLFNCMTKTRDAIVADFPGVTRDRQYGYGNINGNTFLVVDTGGIGVDAGEIDRGVCHQARLAMGEADIIFFLVDARDGLTPADEDIAHELRQLPKPVYLIANKVDGLHAEVATSDFYRLGFAKVLPIAASHGMGVTSLVTNAIDQLPESDDVDDPERQPKGIQVAIVGKPNVGKSTLVNRILGEERVLVYDEPGTTRDSIFIPFERQGELYTLIDTAGMRRRSKVDDVIEKFSIIKTLQAIEQAHVVLMVIDARENISDQDMRLLGHILEAGRALVISINKWDGMEAEERESVRSEIHRRLDFVNFAKMHFISALHGSGVGDLFASIHRAYDSAMIKLTPRRLTDLLEKAVFTHQPPLIHSRRVKLRYAHPGGHNPPIIVIHGNQVESLPESYQRYLINFYREALSMEGTPIRIQLKNSTNPFADRRNQLTPRQVKKRQRLMRFAKGRK